MLIEIPDNFLSKGDLTEADIRLEFALFLFNKNIMTLSQASNFAQIDSYEFQKKLGERKIPIHYTEDDFNDDLNTIKKIFG